MDKIGVAPECAGAEAEGVQIQRAASCYSLWMSVALGEKPNPLPCDFCVRNRATSAGFASSMKRRADNCWRGPPLKRSANAQHETEVDDGWASALPIVGETSRRDGISRFSRGGTRKRSGWTDSTQPSGPLRATPREDDSRFEPGSASLWVNAQADA